MSNTFEIVGFVSVCICIIILICLGLDAIFELGFLAGAMGCKG